MSRRVKTERTALLLLLLLPLPALPGAQSAYPGLELDSLAGRRPDVSELAPAGSAATARQDGTSRSGERPAPTLQQIDAVFARTQHGPFDDLILVAAQHWHLDPFLFKGLLANESRLDPVRHGKRRYGVKNGARMVISGGAMGIAQFTGAGVRAVNLLRKRRRRRGASVLPFDARRALVPQEAIPAAAELLAHLIGRYGRDGGITAYNSGVIGGRAVHQLGFWRARYAGKLRKVGIFPVQGERFLLNVLKWSSWYRQQAGLPPLDDPDFLRPDSRRYANLPRRGVPRTLHSVDDELASAVAPSEAAPGPSQAADRELLAVGLAAEPPLLSAVR